MLAIDLDQDTRLPASRRFPPATAPRGGFARWPAAQEQQAAVWLGTIGLLPGWRPWGEWQGPTGLRARAARAGLGTGGTGLWRRRALCELRPGTRPSHSEAELYAETCPVRI
jgi:hypothetical protein